MKKRRKALRKKTKRWKKLLLRLDRLATKRQVGAAVDVVLLESMAATAVAVEMATAESHRPVAIPRPVPPRTKKEKMTRLATTAVAQKKEDLLVVVEPTRPEVVPDMILKRIKRGALRPKSAITRPWLAGTLRAEARERVKNSLKELTKSKTTATAKRKPVFLLPNLDLMKPSLKSKC